jgi:hypothetical protein
MYRELETRVVFIKIRDDFLLFEATYNGMQPHNDEDEQEFKITQSRFWKLSSHLSFASPVRVMWRWSENISSSGYPSCRSPSRRLANLFLTQLTAPALFLLCCQAPSLTQRQELAKVSRRWLDAGARLLLSRCDANLIER